MGRDDVHYLIKVVDWQVLVTVSHQTFRDKINYCLCCHAKNGMGQKWHPIPLLAEKNGMGCQFPSAKNGTAVYQIENNTPAME